MSLVTAAYNNFFSLDIKLDLRIFIFPEVFKSFEIFQFRKQEKVS